jgi:hypothetical protein
MHDLALIGMPLRESASHHPSLPYRRPFLLRIKGDLFFGRAGTLTLS